MMRYALLLTLAAVALCHLACEENAPTKSGGGQYQLVYPQESAMLALVESREFRPPEDLQIQIDRELLMIREQWGDSIPEVLLEYRDPWEGSLALEVYVDTGIVGDDSTAFPPALKSVLNHFGATMQPAVWGGAGYWTIYPDRPWYPPAAVDSFAGGEGLEVIQCRDFGHYEWFYSSIRQVTDSGTYWYMGSLCGSLRRFHVFRVGPRRAEFVNEYHLCFLSYDAAWALFDTVDYEVPEDFTIRRAYEQYLWEHMPDWYLMASSEVSSFARGAYYRLWTRE